MMLPTGATKGRYRGEAGCWVWRRGRIKFVPGDFQVDRRDRLQIIPDIQPYDSPVDGSYVGSRAARREDLKRNRCREYEPTEKKYVAARRADAEKQAINRMAETLQRFI